VHTHSNLAGDTASTTTTPAAAPSLPKPPPPPVEKKPDDATLDAVLKKGQLLAQLVQRRQVEQVVAAAAASASIPQQTKPEHTTPTIKEPLQVPIGCPYPREQEPTPPTINPAAAASSSILPSTQKINLERRLRSIPLETNQQQPHKKTKYDLEESGARSPPPRPWHNTEGQKGRKGDDDDFEEEDWQLLQAQEEGGEEESGDRPPPRSPLPNPDQDDLQ
jgi:hypothetical protein